MAVVMVPTLIPDIVASVTFKALKLLTPTLALMVNLIPNALSP
jgi:hypothetical protein